MNSKSKTFITAFLVLTVVGVLAYQTVNKNLLKGQIVNESAQANPNEQKPDLKVALSVIAPEEEGGDLSAQITIFNEGPGTVDGSKPFRYAIFLGEKEVFSNVDSYTFMEAGDSFNFVYPISRAIYQYGNSGAVKAVVDTEENVEEENEDNNTAEVNYSL